MKVRIGIGLFTVSFFCFILPLSGQEARGTLLGRVTDPTGAVIVGAKIGATNAATAVRYSATTSGSGDYILPFLISGQYSLTVEMQGFKTSTRSEIAVRESDRITIDVTMQSRPDRAGFCASPTGTSTPPL